MMVPQLSDASQRQIRGDQVKKFIAMLVVAAVAAVPAAAATKKKHKMTKEEADAAEVAKSHDNTLRFLRDGLPLILPSWLMPVYFGTGMDKKTADNKKK
jgi:hypothetical protein